MVSLIIKLKIIISTQYTIFNTVYFNDFIDMDPSGISYSS